VRKIYLKETQEKDSDGEDLQVIQVYLSQPSEGYVLVFTGK
jgi:hypothetical protein